MKRSKEEQEFRDNMAGILWLLWDEKRKASIAIKRNEGIMFTLACGRYYDVKRRIKLIQSLVRYDSPAWRVNERLNQRCEIAYMALEKIIDTGDSWHTAIAQKAIDDIASVT